MGSISRTDTLGLIEEAIEARWHPLHKDRRIDIRTENRNWTENRLPICILTPPPGELECRFGFPQLLSRRKYTYDGVSATDKNGCASMFPRNFSNLRVHWAV